VLCKPYNCPFFCLLFGFYGHPLRRERTVFGATPRLSTTTFSFPALVAKMGAGQSKADESTKHVFASDTPIQFSQEYVNTPRSPGLGAVNLDFCEQEAWLTHMTG
jgi:hypothetical protein